MTDRPGADLSMISRRLIEKQLAIKNRHVAFYQCWAPRDVPLAMNQLRDFPY